MRRPTKLFLFIVYYVNNHYVVLYKCTKKILKNKDIYIYIIWRNKLSTTRQLKGAYLTEDYVNRGKDLHTISSDVG